MQISYELDGHPHGPFEAENAPALYREIVAAPSPEADYIFSAWTFYECPLQDDIPVDQIFIPDWASDGVLWPFYGREPLPFARQQFAAIRMELGLPRPTQGSSNVLRDEHGEPIRHSPRQA